MTERNGLRVDKRWMERYGKNWVFVTTGEDGAAFAFEDWFHMIRLVVEREVEKYAAGDPEQWERWGAMPKEFLARCFDRDVTYEQLRDQFRLPR